MKVLKDADKVLQIMNRKPRAQVERRLICG